MTIPATKATSTTPRTPIPAQRTIERTGLPLALALSLAACGPNLIARDIPLVVFTQPTAHTLYLGSGAQVMRIQFDGKPRMAPFVCPKNQAILDKAKDEASRRYTLKTFSGQPEAQPIKLMSDAGKLVAEGRLCIYPTLLTQDKKILRRYTIEIPAESLKRLAAGKDVALSERYLPAPPRGKPGNYLAWVLYLVPP